MTPKEKAEELVAKFSEYSHTDFEPTRGGYQFKSQKINAKHCALIAVDEILLTLKCDIICIDVDRKSHLDLIKYWQKVKQEIDNL